MKRERLCLTEKRDQRVSWWSQQGSGGGRSWVVVVTVAHTFKEENENRVESDVAYKEVGSGKIPI